LEFINQQAADVIADAVRAIGRALRGEIHNTTARDVTPAYSEYDNCAPRSRPSQRPDRQFGRR
jgi:hypothetical protein